MRKEGWVGGQTRKCSQAMERSLDPLHHGEVYRVLSREHHNLIYIVRRIHLAPQGEHMIRVELGDRIWKTNEEVHSFIYSLCLSKNILMKSLKNTKMKASQAHLLGHDPEVQGLQSGSLQ